MTRWIYNLQNTPNAKIEKTIQNIALRGILQLRLSVHIFTTEEGIKSATLLSLEYCGFLGFRANNFYILTLNSRFRNLFA